MWVTSSPHCGDTPLTAAATHSFSFFLPIHVIYRVWENRQQKGKGKNRGVLRRARENATGREESKRRKRGSYAWERKSGRREKVFGGFAEEGGVRCRMEESWQNLAAVILYRFFTHRVFLECSIEEEKEARDKSNEAGSQVNTQNRHKNKMGKKLRATKCKVR